MILCARSQGSYLSVSLRNDKASPKVPSSSRRSLAGSSHLSVCSSGKSQEHLYSSKSPRYQSRQQLRSMLSQKNSRRSMFDWRYPEA